LGVNIQVILDNNKHVTTLYLASKNRYLVIVEVLIQSGIDINTQISKGIIPLYRAVIYRYEYITRVLLESSVDFIKPLLI
jgi:ankyrin repeat protein